MAQIGLAGVGATLPYVTGPSPSEVPSRRVQDQQSSRPVKEADESDDGGDNSDQVITEDEKVLRAEDNNSRAEEEIDTDREPQVGDQLDISI
ncbi:MAG: hypothetical protein CFH01_00425 [Alphaproteobacteria bacterium MarineAlpha2_Bin1]|nr:MAG: hypothetical protein CFH01_00425 [Alphaproteobacteria bacterium MarineAlpha2_Bin1]|tara:strand:+ start:399 stop:674 length:276 start_codon:yes stop_codon:yes gene_type:complete